MDEYTECEKMNKWLFHMENTLDTLYQIRSLLQYIAIVITVIAVILI